MLHAVKCLSALLAAYEDWWYCVDKLSQVYPPDLRRQMFGSRSRALVNYTRLRRYLLGVHQTSEALDADLFAPAADYPSQRAFVSYVPATLIAWNRFSRRVYQVSDELQAVLSHTSLKGVRWCDIHLPFNAFAVSLARPLAWPGGTSNFNCDFVMVYRIDETFRTSMPPGVYFTFYNSNCRNYEGLNRLNRQHVEKLVRQGKPEQVVNYCRKAMLRTDVVQHFLVAVDETQAEDPISRLVQTQLERINSPINLPAGADEFLDSILRIVLGMVLYMKTRPPGDSRVKQSKQRADSGAAPYPRALTGEVNVCDVSNRYKLSREARALLGLSGDIAERRAVEMCWHFVEGHWRRPPGRGYDASADRTVWVSPYMARKDRMPDEGLPGGAEQRL